MKLFVFARPEKSITFTFSFGLSAAESRTKNRHRTFGDPPKNVQRSFTLFISRIKCAETDVHRFCELLVLPLARDSRNPRQPFFGWFCKVVLESLRHPSDADGRGYRFMRWTEQSLFLRKEDCGEMSRHYKGLRNLSWTHCRFRELSSKITLDHAKWRGNEPF